MSDDNIINHPSIVDSDRTKRLIEKIVTHPLEHALNIEPASTVVMVPEPRNTTLVDVVSYDEKDKEIEENFQEVYDKAMDTFDEMQESMANIEAKSAARQQEVAAMMLTTALAAAKEKARMKEHKDKLVHTASTRRDPETGEKAENISISSSDLIRMLAKERNASATVIESTPIVEPEPEQQTMRSTIKRNVPSQEDN